MASDVLHHRDGTLAHECDGDRLGAHAVARAAAGGAGRTMILSKLALILAAYLVFVWYLWRETL